MVFFSLSLLPQQHDIVFYPYPHPLFLSYRFPGQYLLIRTSHPSGSRQLYFKHTAVLGAPSLKTRPLAHADFAIVAYGYYGWIGPQKIFGTIPCSIGCITNLMVISQPLMDSRHRRIRIKNYRCLIYWFGCSSYQSGLLDFIPTPIPVLCRTQTD